MVGSEERSTSTREALARVMNRRYSYSYSQEAMPNDCI